MEIKQLALVLERIDQIFVDSGLLAVTDRLIVALDEVVAETAAPNTLISHRASLFALHDKIDPTTNGWTAEQRTILDNYSGYHLIGQPVIDTINQAFLDHFMNPAAVLSILQTVRDESEALHQRTQSLLADLDPVLVNETVIIEEVVDGEYAITDEIDDDRNVIQLIRDKLVPVDAVVPNDMSNGMPAIPVRVKVMAAVPVALAVAGKAVDLYMRYSKQRENVPVVKRAKQTPRSRPSNGRVRYYSRQITIIQNEQDHI